MALDTTGSWVAGDELRIVEALGVPFGQYSLTCVENSCNQLEDMSGQAVLNVRAALDEYEAAKAAATTQDLADTEGKTLVKADVLEWEKNFNPASGPQKEMARARNEIAQYFAFSTCLSGLMGNSTYGTSLIRS